MFQGHRNTILGFAAGAAAGISYGLNPLFGKPLIDGGVPVLSMLFFRYAISAVVLGLWIWARQGLFRVTWREFRLLIVLGLLFAASSVFLFESYRYIPSGLATTLVYLYPVFVAVIMVFLKVRPVWQVWLSIAGTVAGVVVLSWPSGGFTLHWGGMTLAALSALSYAFFSDNCEPLSACQTHQRTTAHILRPGGWFSAVYGLSDNGPNARHARHRQRFGSLLPDRFGHLSNNDFNAHHCSFNPTDWPHQDVSFRCV